MRAHACRMRPYLRCGKGPAYCPVRTCQLDRYPYRLPSSHRKAIVRSRGMPFMRVQSEVGAHQGWGSARCSCTGRRGAPLHGSAPTLSPHCCFAVDPFVLSLLLRSSLPWGSVAGGYVQEAVVKGRCGVWDSGREALQEAVGLLGPLGFLGCAVQVGAVPYLATQATASENKRRFYS